MPPVILWIRRDLRLADHPALTAAVESGKPIIPVFIRDDIVDQTGAAPKWRWGLGIDAFDKALQAIGSKLILRSGDALAVLDALIAETGADSVYWSRAYDPDCIARDTEIKKTLTERGVTAQSYSGHLLFEPWTVETKQGSFFKVYSPMWRAVADRDVAGALPAPSRLNAPESWPASDTLADWQLGKSMRRGAEIVIKHAAVGESAALDRLHRFLEDAVDGYRTDRDFPAKPATSRLSENLTYGEISPRTIWHAGQEALRQGAKGAEHFLKELVWREFAYHLIYHTPQIATRNWRAEWDAFPWGEESADAEKWRRGMTGEAFVDAGMRELYVTGTMHNRSRMIVGSYLTKHLLTHWKIGLKWFEECLIDWDPASNAMGWQWVAGCGPDAAPYFRIFNPATQAEKFDADGSYRRQFIKNWRGLCGEDAEDYFAAVPRAWGLDANHAYPKPMIALSEGRNRALAAYETVKKS